MPTTLTPAALKLHPPVLPVDRPAVSVVLPARNEARAIATAIREVDAALAGLGLSYEIIVGDSASSDGTAMVASELGLSHVRVVRQDLPGKGRILTHALLQARGRIVGFLDSDLEIAPEYLRAAILQVLAGSDGAVGSKVLDPATAAARSPFRRTVTATANTIIRGCLGTRVSDHQAGMKVFRREVLFRVLHRVRATGWLWDTEVLALLSATGARVDEVAVRTVANRPSGFSSASQLATAAIELAAVCARVRCMRWSPAAVMTARHASAAPAHR